MCQQKTIYLCRHVSYHNIRCAAKKAQRSSCFGIMAPPPCIRTVSSQQRAHSCFNCLHKGWETEAVGVGERLLKEEPSTKYNTNLQGFHAQLPQKPQAARLRSGSEHLKNKMLKVKHNSTTDRVVPSGVDLSSMAADAYQLSKICPCSSPRI